MMWKTRKQNRKLHAYVFRSIVDHALAVFHVLYGFPHFSACTLFYFKIRKVLFRCCKYNSLQNIYHYVNKTDTLEKHEQLVTQL